MQSASAYPTDSTTISKLFKRICHRIQNAPKLGWAAIELPELPQWISDSQRLNYRICTLTSSSAKQTQQAQAADLQNRRKRRAKGPLDTPQSQDQDQDQDPSPEPPSPQTPEAITTTTSTSTQLPAKSAKERKREELYVELYTLIEKNLPQLREQHQNLQQQSEKLTPQLTPRRQAQHEQFLAEMHSDLAQLEKSLTVSRQRVCEGKPAGIKAGMPLSVSDPTASFIEKGGWQRCFGYRPQLCFSNKSNLVTALIVPTGNASDHSQLLELMTQSVQNTTIIPHSLSLDDGYTGQAQLSGCEQLGIQTVSFSGARGKDLLGTEKWESPEHKAARRARNGAESGISAL